MGIKQKIIEALGQNAVRTHLGKTTEELRQLTQFIQAGRASQEQLEQVWQEVQDSSSWGTAHADIEETAESVWDQGNEGFQHIAAIESVELSELSGEQESILAATVAFSDTPTSMGTFVANSAQAFGQTLENAIVATMIADKEGQDSELYRLTRPLSQALGELGIGTDAFGYSPAAKELGRWDKPTRREVRSLVSHFQSFATDEETTSMNPSRYDLLGGLTGHADQLLGGKDAAERALSVSVGAANTETIGEVEARLASGFLREEEYANRYGADQRNKYWEDLGKVSEGIRAILPNELERIAGIFRKGGEASYLDALDILQDKLPAMFPDLPIGEFEPQDVVGNDAQSPEYLLGTMLKESRRIYSGKIADVTYPTRTPETSPSFVRDLMLQEGGLDESWEAANLLAAVMDEGAGYSRSPDMDATTSTQATGAAWDAYTLQEVKERLVTYEQSLLEASEEVPEDPTQETFTVALRDGDSGLTGTENFSAPAPDMDLSNDVDMPEEAGTPAPAAVAPTPKKNLADRNNSPAQQIKKAQEIQRHIGEETKDTLAGFQAAGFLLDVEELVKYDKAAVLNGSAAATLLAGGDYSTQAYNASVERLTGEKADTLSSGPHTKRGDTLEPLVVSQFAAGLSKKGYTILAQYNPKELLSSSKAPGVAAKPDALFRVLNRRTNKEELINFSAKAPAGAPKDIKTGSAYYNQVQIESTILGIGTSVIGQLTKNMGTDAAVNPFSLTTQQIDTDKGFWQRNEARVAKIQSSLRISARIGSEEDRAAAELEASEEMAAARQDKEDYYNSPEFMEAAAKQSFTRTEEEVQAQEIGMYQKADEVYNFDKTGLAAVPTTSELQKAVNKSAGYVSEDEAWDMAHGEEEARIAKKSGKIPSRAGAFVGPPTRQQAQQPELSRIAERQWSYGADNLGAEPTQKDMHKIAERSRNRVDNVEDAQMEAIKEDMLRETGTEKPGFLKGMAEAVYKGVFKNDRRRRAEEATLANRAGTMVGEVIGGIPSAVMGAVGVVGNVLGQLSGIGDTIGSGMQIFQNSGMTASFEHALGQIPLVGGLLKGAAHLSIGQISDIAEDSRSAAEAGTTYENMRNIKFQGAYAGLSEQRSERFATAVSHAVGDMSIGFADPMIKMVVGTRGMLSMDEIVKNADNPVALSKTYLANATAAGWDKKQIAAGARAANLPEMTSFSDTSEDQKAAIDNVAKRLGKLSPEQQESILEVRRAGGDTKMQVEAGLRTKYENSMGEFSKLLDEIRGTLGKYGEQVSLGIPSLTDMAKAAIAATVALGSLASEFGKMAKDPIGYAVTYAKDALHAKQYKQEARRLEESKSKDVHVTRRDVIGAYSNATAISWDKASDEDVDTMIRYMKGQAGLPESATLDQLTARLPEEKRKYIEAARARRLNAPEKGKAPPNMARMMNRMHDELGLPLETVRAFAAASLAESDGKTDIDPKAKLKGGARADGSYDPNAPGTAEGIFQWRGVRQRNLLKRTGKRSVGDIPFDDQLSFAIQEIKDIGGGSLLKRLQGAKSSSEAIAIINREFLINKKGEDSSYQAKQRATANELGSSKHQTIAKRSSTRNMPDEGKLTAWGKSYLENIGAMAPRLGPTASGKIVQRSQGQGTVEHNVSGSATLSITIDPSRPTKVTTKVPLAKMPSTAPSRR